MNKKVYFAFGCIVGAMAGALTTRNFFRDKYERMAQEEIDSVKESFSKMTEKYKKSKEMLNMVYGQNTVPAEKPDLDSYAARLQELENNTVSSITTKSPEVIPYEEFGEDEEYETISLTYYADGVLADDDDRKMDEESIKSSIGSEALNSFGSIGGYEVDTVYVRNDRLKTYYEICRDERTYDEVLDERPYLEED